MNRNSWSLTLWLTLCNAGSAFLLISLIATSLYFGLATELKTQNRIYLHDEILTIKDLVRLQRGTAAVMSEVVPEQAGVDYVKHYIRLTDPDGRLLLETPGMEGVIPARLFPVPDPDGSICKDQILRTADGRKILYTAASIGAKEAPGGEGIVQVALDVTTVEEILADYRRKIYLTLACGFLLCVVVSFAIARRGTKPLREITDVVRRITVMNLEERISGSGWPRELNTLADALNLMLNRLEDSFNRLHLSATNLSHKMRTPLTILRGEAEVALSRSRSSEELEEVIASSLEEVGRLSRLGENILFLANAEVGKYHPERSLLDCREEADQVIDYYHPSAEEKGIELSCEGRASAMADPMLFRKLVAALVSNALTYNACGGKVAVTLRQREPLMAELRVTDDGCGIPAGEMTRIFDRFYRIYATRHMDPHGTGLGLPIARAIMDLHDGNITIHSAAGQGTTVTVTFPPPAMLPVASPAAASSFESLIP